MLKKCRWKGRSRKRRSIRKGSEMERSDGRRSKNYEEEGKSKSICGHPRNPRSFGHVKGDKEHLWDFGKKG
jgi:hypothetical protein